MKICNSCKAEKKDCEFHKRKASIDGLSAKCRGCQSKYDKLRASNPDRVKARAEYAKTEKGMERTKAAKDKWAKNNKGKVYEITKSYRESNPKKYKAHGMVAYAIKCGNLVKKPCEICGGNKDIHAHHDDYSEPLNIRWLCASHHGEWHRKNGEGLNPC